MPTPTPNPKPKPNWHPSVCPHDCPSACALEVERLAPDKIGRIRGAKSQPYTDGVICAKVSRYAERAHHPDRLTHPLRRTSPKSAPPVHEKITWDAALDLLAEKFTQATQTHGAESVWLYYYGGTMGLVQRDSIIGLQNALGYSGMAKTICTQIAYDGWNAGYGALQGADAREMAHSDLIVIWGCNAAATQINVMHHIRKARKRGAKLVVIDPYQNATAKVADLHLAPRPGTDGALACAIMHTLFAEDLADRPYLAKHAQDADRLEKHLRTPGPSAAPRDAKWAAQITGIPAEEITAFARLYGNTPKSYIRLGIGFSRSRNGAVNTHAVSCLPVISGAWQQLGGGALLATSDSFHINDQPIQGTPTKTTNGKTKAPRVLDMSLIGPILCGDPTALQNGPPVQAMLIQNTNPVLVAPDLGAVKRGFARQDLFTCVHEQFMTETAQAADLILPATMFVEHNDLYRSYGQTFLQLGEAVITPPGECRSNHQVIAALRTRLGVPIPESDTPPPKTKNAHTDITPARTAELTLIDQTLKTSAYPPREKFTNAHFLDCAPSFDHAHFLNGFRHPNKKFRFAPDWQALGPYAAAMKMPPLPDHWNVIDNPTPAHPLRLIAAPSRGYLNSTFTQSPSSQRREKKPFLQIHPRTAANLAIQDGQKVKIGNHRGSVTVTAKLAPRTQPDTVIVEGIWPANAFPENIGINLLISAEPTAPAGGAAFHDTAVWVKPQA